jgi:hypothetical protein
VVTLAHDLAIHHASPPPPSVNNRIESTINGHEDEFTVKVLSNMCAPNLGTLSCSMNDAVLWDVALM